MGIFRSLVAADIDLHMLHPVILPKLEWDTNLVETLRYKFCVRVAPYYFFFACFSVVTYKNIGTNNFSTQALWSVLLLMDMLLTKSTEERSDRNGDFACASFTFGRVRDVLLPARRTPVGSVFSSTAPSS